MVANLSLSQKNLRKCFVLERHVIHAKSCSIFKLLDVRFFVNRPSRCSLEGIHDNRRALNVPSIKRRTCIRQYGNVLILRYNNRKRADIVVPVRVISLEIVLDLCSFIQHRVRMVNHSLNQIMELFPTSSLIKATKGRCCLEIFKTTFN